MLGLLHDARPARRGVGRAHLRDPRRARGHRRPPRCRRPRLAPRRGRVPRRDVRLRVRRRDRRAGARRTSTCTSSPGETVALVGRTGSGKSTIARLLPRFYDVDDGAVLIDGHDVRDLTLHSLRATTSAWCSTSRSCSRSRSATTSPTARPDASLDEVEAAARAAHADEFIDDLPDGYDTVIGERGYTSRAASASASPSPARCSPNPPSSCSTTPPARSTCRSRRHIHDALRAAARRPHHARDRPPALDDQPRRPGRAARRRPGRRRRHPRRAAWPPSPATPRCSPASNGS